MQVQVNTGDGLSGTDTLGRWATDFLNDELGRFADEITRVEVQLTDEAKGKKSSDDMRCMLEARLNGHEPLAVQHHAENMDDAVRGAARKLVRALDHTLGKLDRHEHRVRDTIRKEPDAVEVTPGTELT
jgi:ribosome-associated translation inhibitor RaiA